MSKFGEPQPCRNGCGQYIYFDRDSEKGHPSADKWIPLEYDKETVVRTDEAHQCSNKGKDVTMTTSDDHGNATIFSLLKQMDAKLDRLLQVG